MSQTQTPITDPSHAGPTGDSPRHVQLSGIRWHSVFEWTHLFRGFRMATNPAKLMLALLAVFIIYVTGRGFDAAWGPRAGEGEIEAYQRLAPEDFARGQLTFEKRQQSAIEDLLLESPPKGIIYKPAEMDAFKKSPRSAYDAYKANRIAQFHRQLDDYAKRRIEEEKQREERIKANVRIDETEKSPAEIEQERRQDAAKELASDMRAARARIGRGAFDTFLKYETGQFKSLLGNLFPPSLAKLFPSGNAISGPTTGPASEGALYRSDTVVGNLAKMAVTGPRWFFTASGPLGSRTETGFGFFMVRVLYVLSLVLYALIALVTIAFAGGVICRLTALEFAGVERPPLAEIFSFARRKLLTFIAAPLTPFLILLVGGLLLAIMSMVGAIPYVGEIIGGLFFFLSLAAGFVLMLVLIGILAGYSLIFPTVAVEGSDTFDAMSRAFAYVYARPWRLVFYTALLLIYGAITVLFMYFAIYLLMVLAHTFVGWGVSFFGLTHGAYTGLPKLETLWPTPHLGDLASPINWWAMSSTEYIGSIFLNFWIYLLISVIGAYVVSYYFSSHTILYFLLRRSVEGQSLTEVYRDEPEITVAPSETPAPSMPGTAATSPLVAPPPITPTEPPPTPPSNPEPPAPPAA